MLHDNIEQKIMVSGVYGPHVFAASQFKDACQFAKYLQQNMRIENVITAGGTPEGICFGDLQDQGLLSKSYIPGYGPDYDPTGIEWTVIGDVEFTDSHGDSHKKGDVIVWEK